MGPSQVIVVDTSAVVAILFREPEALLFRQAIAENNPWLPGSCFLEAAIAVRRRGFDSALVEGFLDNSPLRLLGADERQARIAFEADRRYGRKTGHPARLNFGDCLAYAAAMAHDAPLLFKGGDFGHTDVKRAV